MSDYDTSAGCVGGIASQIPPERLLEGIGVASLEDLAAFAVESHSMV